ncbi:MAG: hypothetical protein N4J56_003303 [Chroococcidiopsis sp. SAG 2025]|uniref:polysialyltransferase family glycosyltransferase n=1 Tax=Chroococcidiopsis sp. SAG 2025 TaxID=171389 RepID=UPI002936E759|nr:polysialyltransferase family glycosyltransferase [Chroococcidiopsis sp. SAG 2025]MDV2993649.1 hypothetical protein [Chroococcidiopsis sp. SAG 2025]
MYTPTRLKRLVACQGSIQLITALSALTCREKEQQGTNVEYDNYLVIYDLRTPENQSNTFANFIKNMAEEVCTWREIVYIQPEQMQALQAKLNLVRLNLSNIQQVFSLVHKLTGISSADEIYLSKNYDIWDRLLLNVYESAKKICYGDSIGLYLSASSTVLQVEPRSLSYKLKRLLKSFIYTKNSIDEINFDVGYFTISNFNTLSESPPMEVVTVNKAVTLNIFQRLRGVVGKVVDSDYINNLRTKLANNSVSILLTSNFSEATRMSEENEITAYQKFLKIHKREDNPILIIKPHPRDSAIKIEKLQYSLNGLFSEVIVISELSWFFLPFELFLMEVFLDRNLVPHCDIKIFAFSSACLSLKFLFNLPCIIGFGSDITHQSFYDEQVSKRIQHELELNYLLQQI